MLHSWKMKVYLRDIPPTHDPIYEHLFHSPKQRFRMVIPYLQRPHGYVDVLVLERPFSSTNRG